MYRTLVKHYKQQRTNQKVYNVKQDPILTAVFEYVPFLTRIFKKTKLILLESLTEPNMSPTSLPVKYTIIENQELFRTITKGTVIVYFSAFIKYNTLPYYFLFINTLNSFETYFQENTNKWFRAKSDIGEGQTLLELLHQLQL